MKMQVQMTAKDRERHFTAPKLERQQRWVHRPDKELNVMRRLLVLSANSRPSRLSI